MSRKRSYPSQRHGKAKSTGRSRLGLPMFLLVAAVVLVAAGFLLISALSPKTPVALAGVVDLKADMSGFDKKEVRVQVGQPVTIRLTSMDNSHHTDGGGRHQWAVDEFNANVVAPPEGSNTVTFTPDRPGEYTYYCDICCGGRANPSMQGKLIVEA